MKNKKIGLKSLGLILSLLILSGCTKGDISSSSAGLWDGFILYNLSRFIIWLSNLLGGNYVLGITVFTILIRIILLPLNKIQMDSQRKMQEIQPELNALREKYPNKDRASQQLLQEEQAALMEERGINQFAGCLPLLIQLPVMMALYQSILYTPQLRNGHFLWMNLGQPDPYFVLPTLAAIFTFATTYLSMKSNLEDNMASKSMMYMMPVMIFFIGMGLPSAIAIYWVVTNAFSVVQTLVFNNPYKIIAEREAVKQAEKDRQRELRRQLRQATGKRKK